MPYIGKDSLDVEALFSNKSDVLPAATPPIPGAGLLRYPSAHEVKLLRLIAVVEVPDVFGGLEKG